VRRVVGAIARALGMPEPQLYLARAEPGIVAPVAAEAPGVLVGAEAPSGGRCANSGSCMLAPSLTSAGARTRWRGFPPAPGGPGGRAGPPRRPPQADLSALAAPDLVLAECLARHLGPDALARLSPLAARLAAEAPPDWDALALGIRESAERVALAVCGDPASAISIVCGKRRAACTRPRSRGSRGSRSATCTWPCGHADPSILAHDRSGRKARLRNSQAARTCSASRPSNVTFTRWSAGSKRG